MIVPDISRDLTLTGVIPGGGPGYVPISPYQQPGQLPRYSPYVGPSGEPVGSPLLRQPGETEWQRAQRLVAAPPAIQQAGVGGVISAITKYAPPVIAALGGAGLLGAILGSGGETGQEGAISQEIPGGYLAGMGQEFSMGRLPWSTPAGEGFIAPWTPNVVIGWEGQPSNVVYGQTGKDYPGYLEPHKLPSPPVKYWYANGIPFARLADGRIACERRDGTVKVWRPKKHIVISNNPRLSQLRKLDRVYKKVTKMVRRYAPKVKAARPITSPYLSAVERKALKA